MATRFKYQGCEYQFERTGRVQIELRVTCDSLGTSVLMWVEDGHPTKLLREQVVDELNRREHVAARESLE